MSEARSTPDTRQAASDGKSFVESKSPEMSPGEREEHRNGGKKVLNEEGRVIGITSPELVGKLINEFYHEKSKGFTNEQGYHLEGTLGNAVVKG